LLKNVATLSLGMRIIHPLSFESTLNFKLSCDDLNLSFT
jgi:hypothetical protein